MCILTAREIEAGVESRNATKDGAANEGVVGGTNLKGLAGGERRTMEKAAGTDPCGRAGRKLWKDGAGNHIGVETALREKEFVKPMRRGHFIIVKESDGVDGTGFLYDTISYVSNTATLLDEISEWPGKRDGGADWFGGAKMIVVYDDDFDLRRRFLAKDQVRDAEEKCPQKFWPFVGADADGDSRVVRLLMNHFKHTQRPAQKRALVQVPWNRRQGGSRDRRP